MLLPSMSNSLIYYQFFEDFKSNEDRLHIEAATKRLDIPHLIIHGTKDPAVWFVEAEALHEWNPKSELFPIPESDHVFGAKHPARGTEQHPGAVFDKAIDDFRHRSICTNHHAEIPLRG